MGKTNKFETEILELLLQNITLPEIGDAVGLGASTLDGSVYISLLTADPTDEGLIANEATYTGYLRKDTSRGIGEWTVSGDTVSNANAITFDAATGGSSTVTHFGLHFVFDGSMMMSGALTSSLAVSDGITPEFAIGALTITED